MNQDRQTHSLSREWRTCLAMVGPLYLGQCAQMLMGVADTVMAGRYSAMDLSAVALGNGFWIPLYLFSIGLLSALQPLIARALGARRLEVIIPLWLWACFLAVVLSACCILVLNDTEWVFLLAKAEPAVAQLAEGYTSALSFGVLPNLLLMACRGCCDGLGRTRIFMVFFGLMAVINIALNAVLIYGFKGADLWVSELLGYGGWNLPALGAVGCGYATAASNWLGMLIFVVYAWRTRLFSGYFSKPMCLSEPVRSPTPCDLPESTKKDAEALFRVFPLWALLRLGGPVALHLLAEGATFASMVLLIAPLGAIAIASSEICLNVISFFFMVPLSFGMALTIRISYLLGAQSVALAGQLAKSSLWLIVILGLILGLFLLFAGEWVAGLYTEDAEVVLLTAQLLTIAAVFQLCDSGQIILVNVLRGFHDTQMPMWILLLSLWGIALPVGYLLAYSDVLAPALGVSGFWVGFVLGLFVDVMLLIWRLRTIVLRQSAADRVVGLACE